MKYTFILLLLVLVGCGGDDSHKKDKKDKKEQSNEALNLETDTIVTKSDYDMSTVDKKNQKEFKENLAKIEKVHGEQWDFCTCVVKNDSINKAFSQPVSDAQFDRLSLRFDEIDQRCKAFLLQSPNVTPEERIKHEKKVRNCLKEAGIK